MAIAWWLPRLQTLLNQHDRLVMVTLIATQGSTPQTPGARLLVSAAQVEGSIGGGRLEWLATQQARDCLNGSEPRRRFSEDHHLGNRFGQCCGGSVSLLFELFTPADRNWLTPLLNITATGGHLRLDLNSSGSQRQHLDQPPPARFDNEASAWLSDDGGELRERFDSQELPLYLFGAGHVGQALVQQLQQLPFAIHWIDSRAAEQIPVTPPADLQTRFATPPINAARQAEPGALFLIMTHDHAEDFAILHAILQRADAAWVGLIGSASKWASFQHRLRDAGCASEALRWVSCPIGIPGIRSKQPAIIAASVTAQLLLIREQLNASSDHSTQSTPSNKESNHVQR